jgi:hypothetical protein
MSRKRRLETKPAEAPIKGGSGNSEDPGRPGDISGCHLKEKKDISVGDFFERGEPLFPARRRRGIQSEDTL